GTVGFEQHIDKCLDLSQYLYNKIKNREGFQMVFNGVPQHTNVCFWYIPPSLRGMPDSDERREKLHRVIFLSSAFYLLCLAKCIISSEPFYILSCCKHKLQFIVLGFHAIEQHEVVPNFVFQFFILQTEIFKVLHAFVQTPSL
ncbi:hypothetical protein ILYODFUR_006725, partial [Ilyodon furcidens]